MIWILIADHGAVLSRKCIAVERMYAPDLILIAIHGIATTVPLGALTQWRWMLRCNSNVLGI